MLDGLSRYWMSLRPDAVEALSNDTLRRALNWYYSILLEDAPAKFWIARAIPVEDNIAKLSLDELWKIHSKKSSEFESLWREIRGSSTRFSEFKQRFREASPSLLDLEIEIAKRMLKSCRFCEWRCGVDRTAGRRGVCGLDTKTYVHSWFLHLGEEAPLVPSGTIFYGSCNFRCVYCQNWDISQEHPFEVPAVNARQLALIQRELALRGARNINHVGGEPTPNLHTILESLKYLDVNIAQLWNSNFYMSEEALKLLIYVIDIWLPDFKYGNNNCALRLSKIPRYVDVVTRNLKIAVNYGDMIIRHLVLPNHIECCSIKVLDWIAENLPRDRVLVNIMDQYRPEYKAYEYKEISRRPNSRELETVYNYADSKGILWRDISR